MPPRNLLWLLALIALVVGLYLFRPNKSDLKSTQPSSSPSPTLSTTATAKKKQISAHKKTPLSETLLARAPVAEASLDSRITRYTDGSADLTTAIQASAELHQGDKPARDLELIKKTLSQYRAIYKENPVGVENFEFTAALTGNNPKKVNFIDPNSPALTANNELVDRWGSPFVFHPQSATSMELRSLGPDKTLWTDDDITLKDQE